MNVVQVTWCTHGWKQHSRLQSYETELHETVTGAQAGAKAEAYINLLMDSISLTDSDMLNRYTVKTGNVICDISMHVASR